MRKLADKVAAFLFVIWSAVSWLVVHILCFFLLTVLILSSSWLDAHLLSFFLKELTFTP
jgi:hypothetical protein